MRRRPENEYELKNEDNLKNEDDLKNENNLKNEDGLKNKNDLKNEDDLKNENDLKNWPFPQNYFVPPPSPFKKLPEIFSMTSHLEGHTTTDVIPNMLSGVKTGNKINIIHTALPSPCKEG